MTLMVTILRLHYAKFKKKISLQPHKIIFAHTGKKNLQEGVVWLD